MKYYISKTISDTTVANLRPVVEEALKTEGFGVLTEIDIQAVMKKKLDKDYLPHLILGACSPVYADQVLTIDPNMSTLLPCNVTLRQLENGNVEVSAVAPLVAMNMVDNPEIEKSAKDINDKLNNVIDSI